MDKVQRFEDLIAWQKARQLTQAIYQATRESDFARDFGLAGQIQRSAVSIMSNVTEGFERHGQTDFHHFLVIAKSSCAELRSQLYVAHDVGYLSESEFDQLMTNAIEVSRILGGPRASIAKQLE